MATPLGHGLFGLALGRIGIRPRWSPPRWWYAYLVVAANAPDLDFLPGLVIGDINRFHHDTTHSMAAAVLFGLVVAWAYRGTSFSRRHVAFAGVALYLSHLVLDLLTVDARPPTGIPLLWPLSSTHLASPVTFFGGVRHGVPGDGIGLFVRELLSWHNVQVIAVEVLALGSIAMVAWQNLRRRSSQE